MNNRDMPASPSTSISADVGGVGGPLIVKNIPCHGLTKYEYTIIEFVKASMINNTDESPSYHMDRAVRNADCMFKRLDK